MHRYEILPIIRLTDIEIYIKTDTDNQSDVCIYQNSTCIWQNYHFKNTILVLVYENNVIKVCKINCPINQPKINDTDTAKMWPIKPIIKLVVLLSILKNKELQYIVLKI